MRSLIGTLTFVNTESDIISSVKVMTESGELQ